MARRVSSSGDPESRDAEAEDRVYPLQPGAQGVCGQAGALAVFECGAVVEGGKGVGGTGCLAVVVGGKLELPGRCVPKLKLGNDR